MKGLLRNKNQIIALIGVFFTLNAWAYEIHGVIQLSDKGKIPSSAEVFINNTAQSVKVSRKGTFHFTNLEKGKYSLQAFVEGYKTGIKEVSIIDKSVSVSFSLSKLKGDLDELVVKETKQNEFGILRLKPVEGTAIYASKKSEVVLMEDLSANLATNNSREVFSKVSGIHVWESDGAGIQLGIGGRGLSPSRTSNFNTRQNGYDISADALGYPESYYSPASQAVQRIEVVRGAASLQYGTQFGGFINFKLKDPVKDRKLQFNTEQSVGSYGFFNSFNELSGTTGKWGYIGMLQYKRGDGWRANSNFDQQMGYGKLAYQHSENTKLAIEHTYMYYLAKQPGGMDERQFEKDPRTSLRDRNWFTVRWNLSALTFDHEFSTRLKLNSRFFMLNADKASVGYMGNITRPDPDSLERDLLADKYFNYGNETRLLYTYSLGSRPANWLIGVRYYKGHTKRRQGIGSSGRNADFNFSAADENRELLDKWKNALVTGASNYDFPSENISAFSEHIFPISKRFSLTPGVRFEYIATIADGYYDNITYDIAGKVLEGGRIPEYRSNYRAFALLGLGASYKRSEKMEVYGNLSQNYRGLTFNDVRIVNPNLEVDENLKDESGYSSDVGIRGQIGKNIAYDGGLFFIWYKNKIANILAKSGKRFRTNAPDARMLGAEGFIEWNFWKQFFGEKSKSNMSVFANFSLVDAVYVNTEDPQFKDHKVEMAPPVILRTGTSFKRSGFVTSLQFSYTSQHYSESTNAEKFPNPIFGEIPAYYVLDLSFKYSWKRYKTSLSINNLTDNRYFTRRADGYPGPGILPSDGRGIFFMIGAKF